METLFIIPARGGSKGVPRKNLKELNGKPLIYYAIDAARTSTTDQHICVTTDDDEIINVVEAYGLPIHFKRPNRLASDHSGMSEVLLHALEYYSSLGVKYERIVLLQPTSPFRTGEHVLEALKLYSRDIDMVVSVKETSSNPYYVLFEETDEGFLKKSKDGNFVRRQDCPKVWEYNGAIYIINVESLINNKSLSFEKKKKYVMDETSSMDIDEPLDWIVCEMMIENGYIKK